MSVLGNNSYKHFAFFYDRLTENIDYQQIADYYLNLANKHGVSSGKLVDLACGTGSLSALFSQNFDVIGVDLSSEMLMIAASKNPEIFYVRQDITKLNLGDKYDVVVCSLDSLNHLQNQIALEKAIKGVAKHLREGGLFLFDMNSVYKHKNILGNNTFVYDMNEVFCVWQNDYSADESHKVEIKLDIFEQKNKAYVRHEESFSETAYERDVIEQLLELSGFELCDVYDYLSEKAPSETTEKYAFVAKKR